MFTRSMHSLIVVGATAGWILAMPVGAQGQGARRFTPNPRTAARAILGAERGRFVIAQADTTAAGNPASGASSSADSSVTGPMTSDEAARQLGQREDRATDISRRLLLSEHEQLSLGWRLWWWHTPPFIVSLFTHVEPGWPGGTSFATGPEFVYRNGGMDIVLGGMFVGHGAPAGFFRGQNEPDNAMEMVRSELWGLYLTSHFLWGIKFHPMFELQLGGGLGLGYIGGNLYRSQAYFGPAQPGTPDAMQPDAMERRWRDCYQPGVAPECGTENDHYTRSRTGSPYIEPNWFGRGYVPVVIPHLSVPVALHFRPHRNVDVRLDAGFAFIAFYAGGAVHVVF